MDMPNICICIWLFICTSSTLQYISYTIPCGHLSLATLCAAIALSLILTEDRWNLIFGNQKTECENIKVTPTLETSSWCKFVNSFDQKKLGQVKRKGYWETLPARTTCLWTNLRSGWLFLVPHLLWYLILLWISEFPDHRIQKDWQDMF